MDDDIIEKIQKVSLGPDDILLVFTDLDNMPDARVQTVVKNIRSDFQKVFGEDTRVAVVHKNIEIAVVSKTSSPEKSDAS